MMKSIIICEGETDGIILSYYLNKMYGWESVKTENGKAFLKKNDNAKKETKISFDFHTASQKVNWYFREDSLLAICETGGNSQIISAMDEIWSLYDNLGYTFPDKIVFMTDRDDENIEKNIISDMEKQFNLNSVSLCGKLENNNWCRAEYEKYGETKRIDILPLVIPFEKCGAMETFLLDSLAEKNDGEKEIVAACRAFVQSVENVGYVKNKYLTRRGLIPKSEFSSYFAIASPARTFAKGDEILKSVPWEKYNNVQKAFALFEKLHSALNDE